MSSKTDIEILEFINRQPDGVVTLAALRQFVGENAENYIRFYSNQDLVEPVRDLADAGAMPNILSWRVSFQGERLLAAHNENRRKEAEDRARENRIRDDEIKRSNRFSTLAIIVSGIAAIASVIALFK